MKINEIPSILISQGSDRDKLEALFLAALILIVSWYKFGRFASDSNKLNRIALVFSVIQASLFLLLAALMKIRNTN